MPIRNKRETLARLLGGLGVWGLLERLARRPCLVVPTYHRIGSPARNPFYDPVYSATAGQLEAQVRYLTSRFRILNLDELLELAAQGFAAREPCAFITFDDGYRDNFELALPVLRSQNVPAAFFLPTGFLDHPRLPWWDRIAYVIKQTTQPRLVLDMPHAIAVDLSHTPRADATWTIIRAFMAEPALDEAAFHAHLEDRARVNVDSEALGLGLFLTWDQARKLAEAGMAIGSHTHNHPNLARLREPDQLRELRDSRHILGQQLGREIHALAYPYGHAGSFTPATERLTREAGYRLAFSALAGINRPRQTNPMVVHRLGIGATDSLPIFRARAVSQMAFGRSVF